MDALLNLVGGSRERDKWIRLCQYTLKFCAASGQTRVYSRLGKIADLFSTCRAILRLFDNFPTLVYTLQSGFGRKESNAWMKCLEFIHICANQLYYFLDSIALFQKEKIVEFGPCVKNACVVAWGTALACEILKAIGGIFMTRSDQRELLKKNESESSEMSHDISHLRALQWQELWHYVDIIENAADLINAINWHTSGYLWSGKCSPRLSGAMGMISSGIKVYKLHKR